MQRPSDETGWVGGRQVLPAAEATCACEVSSGVQYERVIRRTTGQLTSDSQQYVSGCGLTFSKKNLQVPKEIV